ncbi:Glycosyl transferase family 2 [Singulisphaera sp. GP187]|nr:Glycosyl transferase family 2 [Singulisphaera sp. GP187]
MGVSIAIATYNRAEELERTLISLDQVDRAGLEDYEILIVDNRSSDHTSEVAARMSHRFSGRLRYIHEPKQGLSHARNRAISEACFPIIVFVDDDVNFDGNWLRHLMAAFETGGHAAIGGRASLIFPQARPKWLGERDEGLLTKVELGSERRPANPGELFGLNLALLKEWVDHVGGFRTDLGRVGKCLLGGEESELLERIAAAGGTLLYEPALIVGHRVPPERLRRRWFWSRCYWGERGEMRVRPEQEVCLHEVIRRGWHVALTCKDLSRALLSLSPGNEECFHYSCVLAGRLGACVGMFLRLATKPRLVPFHSVDRSESRLPRARAFLVGSSGLRDRR